MRSLLLILSGLLFFAAMITSVVGTSWNDYAHHTALTGAGQVLFVASFLPLWNDFKFRRKK